MERNEVAELINDFKNHLRENDGEVVYWGDEIVRRGGPPRPPESAIPDVDTWRRAGTEAGPYGKAAALENLRVNVIGDCHRCPLGDTRIKLVFGVGNPEAKVMFVGEGPGFDEDRKGDPFVGKAGQLLDKIMAAIGLDRTNVYIANIAKCHPMVDATQPDKRGNDRPPSPEEIESCRPFLIEQIKIIRPDVIVTLGGTATKALLRTTQGITALRGKFTQAVLIESEAPISVLPTFHPAALLRDPELKKSVWDDMKLLRDHISRR